MPTGPVATAGAAEPVATDADPTARTGAARPARPVSGDGRGPGPRPVIAG
jgi:hypothetical protein